jgi:hypothetical protein
MLFFVLYILSWWVRKTELRRGERWKRRCEADGVMPCWFRRRSIGRASSRCWTKRYANVYATLPSNRYRPLNDYALGLTDAYGVGLCGTLETSAIAADGGRDGDLATDTCYDLKIAHWHQSVNQNPARCEIGSRANRDDRQHSDWRSRVGRQLKNSAHGFSFSHFES